MLATAAAGVTWAATGDPFAPGSRARSIASASLGGLVRLVAPPARQRVVVYTTIGAMLLCLPLAVFYQRKRRLARRREELALEQQARAPQVFQAARSARPLRRTATPATSAPPVGDGLPAAGELPPEVASRAAELQASAVREAAARAMMLRAASERSETRRRAAGLRARARHDRAAGDGARATEQAAPEPIRAAETTEALPRIDAGATPLADAPARRVQPAATTAATLPTQEPAPPVAASAAATRRAEGTERAQPPERNVARVAILRTSGPLTFEWLEQCLARDPRDIQARLDLCTALLVAERFADAERVAREGLEGDESNGRLLLRLSEALAGLERTDEALAVAVRAVRSHRSRKAILHLTRLSALGHRFSLGDGPRLRKAVESRPGDPVFLHALGVFEAQHGNADEALPILRLALRQERSPRWRRVISREIARLRARELAGAVLSGGDTRRAAG